MQTAVRFVNRQFGGQAGPVIFPQLQNGHDAKLEFLGRATAQFIHGTPLGLCWKRVVSQSDALDKNAYINNVAPYPDFTNIYELDSNGTASYNSLQATVDHHMAHGLQVQSSFTWSKAIDVASSGNISFGSPYLGDPFDLRWNRGVSSLSVPFTSVTNFIY